MNFCMKNARTVDEIDSRFYQVSGKKRKWALLTEFEKKMLFCFTNTIVLKIIIKHN